MSDSDDRSARGAGVGPDTVRGVLARFDALMADTVAMDDQLLPDRLCRAVTHVLDVDGAAISVYLGGDITVPIGANDLDASMGEALQFTVREGPCFDAYSSLRAVLIPDVHDPDSPAWSRWPTYAAQLTEHTDDDGEFAYPLLVSGSVMGSLSLYRLAGGRPDHLGAMSAIADRVADQLLAAESFTGPDGEPVHRWMEAPASRRRRLVWQAQGLTALANQITPGQAIELLRARAFSADRLLDDIAAGIISGQLPVPVLDSDH